MEMIVVQYKTIGTDWYCHLQKFIRQTFFSSEVLHWTFEAFIEELNISMMEKVHMEFSSEVATCKKGIDLFLIMPNSLIFVCTIKVQMHVKVIKPNSFMSL